MTPLAAPAAVLFDRDDTLVVNVPYNGDPELVAPMPTVHRALDRLRGAEVKLGVVTNQSGIARGLITREQVDAVNQRVEDILGPFDVWHVCPHGPDDACACRKPLPGLITAAAERLGIGTDRIAVIGDIGSDMAAAAAAGARGILVPTPVTLRAEVAAAREVAATVDEAVVALLSGKAR